MTHRITMIALAIMAIGLTVFGTGCASKPNAGEIGVVRNGGPFDNHNIRQVVPNGAGNTWVGWFSSTHYYPVDSQQRFFRMATCYDNDNGQVPCDGADGLAVTVPTADGVDVTIEGTFYLNTVFNNSKEGIDAVKAFDTQFATRTFDGDHAYDGTTGWEHFLAAIVEPIVTNNLRETISGVTCADLVASCALVQNQGQQGTSAVQEKAKSGVNKNNVAQVQDAVQTGLEQDLDSTLHRRYFNNIQFKLARVVLPDKIQGAINDAQSAFAAVSQSQAKVQQAKADAAANEERQRGYNNCPTCRQIDVLKALPQGLQALGSNALVAVGK